MKKPGASPPLVASDPLDSVWLGTVHYNDALALQRQVHGDVAAGRRGHTLLLLEHTPVYTLGRRGGREYLHASDEALAELGVEVIQTDRGGLVTFHGPGQLVAYPVIHLARMGKSLGWFIRRLLEATVSTATELGVKGATADPDRPGVWVGNRKLASVGVRYTGGATLHGAALNLDVDLGWFRRMSPCGLEVDATSIVEEGAPRVDVRAAGARVHAQLAGALGLACASNNPEIA